MGVFWVPLFALACQGSGSSGRQDAGPTTDTSGNLSLPEVPPGCPPDAGNSIGIGAPCTKTGNECTGGLQCSCKDWYGYTMPASMPCFCTSVGSACSGCGDNASCCSFQVPLGTTTLAVSACFPAVCLTGGTQCPVIQF